MKFGKEEPKTSNKELSDVLKQFSNKGGFVEIDGKSKQLFIGEIKEVGEFIEVEVLPGCDKVALVDTMHKIIEETNKEVRAVFGDEKIIMEPENMNKER